MYTTQTRIDINQPISCFLFISFLGYQNRYTEYSSNESWWFWKKVIFFKILGIDFQLIGSSYISDLRGKFSHTNFTLWTLYPLLDFKKPFMAFQGRLTSLMSYSIEVLCCLVHSSKIFHGRKESYSYHSGSLTSDHVLVKRCFYS